MPGPVQRSATTFRAAIERYFDVALYLMVLSGFGTLAGTGRVDFPTVLLIAVVLLFRGYLLVRRKRFILPERWITGLTIFFTAFYIADYLLFSGSFVTATVHLVLFLMVVRLLSAHRDRDYVLLTILSFLMVLSASVLTVDSMFLFSFAAFMLTAVATFVLLEMRRSAAASIVQARDAGEEAQGRLGWSLLGATPVLVLCILLGAAAIFFLLPRLSGGFLSAYSSTGDVSTGFSNRVELGRIGQIQQSNSVVMHIEIDGDKRGLHDLKWRGVALGLFDGRVWSNPLDQAPALRAGQRDFLLMGSRAPWENLRHEPAPPASIPIHYRVLMEPIGTNVFFLAPRAQTLQGKYNLVTMDRAAAVYNLDAEHPISFYEADSNIARPSAAALRTSATGTPAAVGELYLQLPALDPRIPQLAQQITQAAHNDYDRATAVERYLITNYHYTLQLGGRIPKDPLANFLFVRKQGHCEYFASAMAVVLRTLHIPSRVVNGFRTGEFNDINSQYVVRARNAHSWVEAYFPGYGWISFDPTPAAVLPTRTGWNRMALYLDAMSSFWREWVIDYDLGHQRTLSQQAAQTTRQTVERVRLWWGVRYEAMLAAARRVRHHMIRAPRTWTLCAIGAVILLGFLIKSRSLGKALRSYRLACHPERSPQQAASIWYQRMTRLAARRGWTKSPMQTPSEFVRSIQDAGLRESVSRFTERYEKARFAESTEDARQLPELYEEISSSK
jgi:protein-glutamine gamma-glutamyltransferase